MAHDPPEEKAKPPDEPRTAADEAATLLALERALQMAKADVAATDASADAPIAPEPAETDTQLAAQPQTDAPSPVGVDAHIDPQPTEAAQPDPAAEKAAKRKKRRARQLREIRSFLTNLILTVAAVWAIFTFVFGVYILDGEDMYPRMRDGDLVLFFRMEDDYVVDDVLTFTIDDTRYTSRYIAMAGDVVDITEEGFLLINSTVQSEEIFYATYQVESDIEFPYTVPDGCVFVLGDFRTLATDSRVFGAIPLDEIDGKVITLLRRRVI